MTPYRAGQADAELLRRNLTHPRNLIAAWRTSYNTKCPYPTLGYQTSAAFALHLTAAIGASDHRVPG